MKLFAAAAMIAAAPFAAAHAQTAPSVVPMIQADGTVLDVTATGETTRVPDLATIRAGVVTQNATAGGALAENADRMARVLAALKRAGVAPRDIATANVSLQPQYRYGENVPPVITGYQASYQVSVRFRDGRCVTAEGRVTASIAATMPQLALPPTLSGNARCEGAAPKVAN